MSHANELWWCQVYCLPFASGSSLVFAPWEDEVIEVVAVARGPRWLCRSVECSGVFKQPKLHHRRPQTVAQISHEISETSPEHGHTRPAGKQDGTKTRDKLGWETSQEGEHSIPDQMGDKLGDKTRDKKKTSPGGQTQHPR